MKDGTGEIVNPTGWGQTTPGLSGSTASLPSFGPLFQVDIFGAFSELDPVAVVLLIFPLMLADFSDTMSTMVAIGGEAKLLDENGNLPRSRETLLVNSLMAVVDGVGGVSSNISYIEFSAGVGEDARTDLASVTTGLLFLASTFLSLLTALVPTEVAFMALVFVSLLVMMQVVDIDWSKAEIVIPVFLTTAFMPFIYSITAGVDVGLVTYMFIRIVRGQAKRVHLLMWFVLILFIIYFLLGPVEALIGWMIAY